MTSCRSKTKTAKGFRADGGGGRTRRIRNSWVRREKGERAGSMTNRKRSMYNLKPHSAFKLLTMAAGYKVFCWSPDSSMRSCGEGGAEGVRSSAIQKFDLFERRLRTAGGGGPGGSGQILRPAREEKRDTRDGEEREGVRRRKRANKKIKGLKSVYFAAGIQPSYMCDTFQNSAPPSLSPAVWIASPPPPPRLRAVRELRRKSFHRPCVVKSRSEPWPFSQKLARILGKEFHAGKLRHWNFSLLV